MKVNSRMKAFWRVSHERSHDLPVELQDLLDAGWQIGPAGSLLLKGLYGEDWGTWSLEDVASHEYEVNDVWIPSAGLPRERDAFLRGLVERSRDFAVSAIGRAQGMNSAELLVAAISVGVDEDYRTHGGTVKFFTRRGGYPRYYEDLERYQLEAVATVEAADLAERGLDGN